MCGEVRNVQTLHTNTHNFCLAGNQPGPIKVTHTLNMSRGQYNSGNAFSVNDCPYKNTTHNLQFTNK